MLSSQELLEEAAKTGTFHSEPWPSVLQDVLTRLETIVYSEFAIPASPPPKKLSSPFRSPPPPAPPGARSTSSPNPITSPAKGTETETSPAHGDSSAPPSSPPAAAASAAMENNVLPSDAAIEGAMPPPPLPESHLQDQLPQELLIRYNFVRRTLTTQFATHPPHTIQRLAELVLRPKQHYKFLHAYLNALDRIMSVTSGANVFPLPPVETPQKTVIQVNGEKPLAQDIEELGGAVLTPIPWLREDRSDVNGDLDEDSPEEERAVTQGELLRQQQEQSAPPDPVVHAPNPDEPGEGETSVDPAEQPQATGPTEIGAEDMGPQQHAVGGSQILDMEAAVGRPLKSPPPTHSDEDEEEPKSDDANDHESGKDSEGDVMLQDANGISKQAPTQDGAEEVQEGVGSEEKDAVT